MLAFDLTPTAASLYEEKRGREETPVDNFEKQRWEFEQTFFVGLRNKVPLLEMRTDPTATGQELRAAPGHPSSGSAQDENDGLKARDLRLALLARKYEGAASVEDTARLQILTERLRNLAPRVTAKDVEQVALMVADAEVIAAKLAAVKDKFGLR
jgi:hypothetical protein